MEEDTDPNQFLKLPTEIIQYIAYLLPRDVDVINFSLGCFFLAQRILPAKSLVWSGRFRDHYDVPRDRSALQLKLEYQIRRIVLSQRINFSRGENEQQTLWLQVLQNMLCESFSVAVAHRQTASKSFQAIRQLLFESDFLNRPVCGYALTETSPPSDLFCAVQLCLTDLVLDPSMRIRCLRTDYDIAAVYAYQADIAEPLVSSIAKLDLHKVLHIRNFWLRHLMNPDEATFHSSFSKLPEYHRPKGRKSFLGDGSGLSIHWLGYESCIHPYPHTLASLEERQTCADLDTHFTQAVEPMSLQLKPHKSAYNWPSEFDLIIPILGGEEHRTYFRGIQKTHGAITESTYLVRGFVERVTSSQGGFLGWNRIGFVIYEPNRACLPLHMGMIDDEEEDGEEGEGDIQWFPKEMWPPSDFVFDFHWIHGYEGVILPGGRIILGRWMDMVDGLDRGPFIFWDC